MVLWHWLPLTIIAIALLLLVAMLRHLPFVEIKLFGLKIYFRSTPPPDEPAKTSTRPRSPRKKRGGRNPRSDTSVGPTTHKRQQDAPVRPSEDKGEETAHPEEGESR